MTDNSQTKKRHHQIPQFYLRHFASPGTDQIWNYDKRDGRVFRTSILNTACETHLYSVPNEDGSRNTEIENLLSDIEGKAAAQYPGLLTGTIPTGQQKADLASFLASMCVRTNSYRRAYAETHGHAFQEYMYKTAHDEKAFNEMVERQNISRGSPLSTVEKEAYRQSMLDPSGLVIEIDRTWTLKAIGLHDGLMKAFRNMNWALLRAPKDWVFITSDAPVIMANCPDPKQIRFSKTVQVSFPLSSEVCLLVNWPGNARTHLEAFPHYLRKLNSLQAAHAERFLFAPIESSMLKKLAAKYQHERHRVGPTAAGPSRRAEIVVTSASDSYTITTTKGLNVHQRN